MMQYLYSVVYSRNFSRYLIFNVLSSNVVVHMLLLRALYRYNVPYDAIVSCYIVSAGAQKFCREFCILDISRMQVL